MKGRVTEGERDRGLPSTADSLPGTGSGQAKRLLAVSSVGAGAQAHGCLLLLSQVR